MNLSKFISASSNQGHHGPRAIDLYALPHGLSGAAFHLILLGVIFCLSRSKAPLTARPLHNPYLNGRICLASWTLGFSAFMIHEITLQQLGVTEMWTIFAGMVNFLYLVLPTAALGSLKTPRDDQARHLALRIASLQSFAKDEKVEDTEARFGHIIDWETQKDETEQAKIPRALNRHIDSFVGSFMTLPCIFIALSFMGLTATMDFGSIASSGAWALVICVPLVTICIVGSTIYKIISTQGMERATEMAGDCGGWHFAIADAFGIVFAMVVLELIPFYMDYALAGNKGEPFGLPAVRRGWQDLVFNLYAAGLILPVFCS